MYFQTEFHHLSLKCQKQPNVGICLTIKETFKEHHQTKARKDKCWQIRSEACFPLCETHISHKFFALESLRNSKHQQEHVFKIQWIFRKIQWKNTSWKLSKNKMYISLGWELDQIIFLCRELDQINFRESGQIYFFGMRVGSNLFCGLRVGSNHFIIMMSWIKLIFWHKSWVKFIFLGPEFDQINFFGRWAGSNLVFPGRPRLSQFSCPSNEAAFVASNIAFVICLQCVSMCLPLSALRAFITGLDIFADCARIASYKMFSIISFGCIKC